MDCIYRKKMLVLSLSVVHSYPEISFSISAGIISLLGGSVSAISCSRTHGIQAFFFSLHSCFAGKEPSRPTTPTPTTTGEFENQLVKYKLQMNLAYLLWF